MQKAYIRVCAGFKAEEWARFNPAAALLLVEWGTKIPVPAAGKQTDIRHSRDGSPGRIYCNPSASFHPTSQDNLSAFYGCVSFWLFVLFCFCLLYRFALHTAERQKQKSFRHL